MEIKRAILRILSSGVLFAAVNASIPAIPAQAPTKHQTEKVVLVMIDGMRWQEVFHGADPDLLETLGSDMPGDAKERAELARQRYARPTEAERRQALMPFMWSVISSQ